MSDQTDPIAVIERLRAMGARRVRVGDLEVEWDGPPAAPPPPVERVAPETAQLQAREEAESLLYAASG